MREKALITFLNDRQFSSTSLLEGLDSQHKQMVSVNEQLSLKRSEIEVAINVRGPIKLIPLGDTHLFSRFTNLDAVKSTLKMLDEPNSFGFITGDFIEGVCSRISEHPGSVELAFGEQIVAAAELLRPYFYSNKLLCAVDGYFGHEGWSKMYSGIDAVEMTSRLMPKVDLNDPRNSDKWKYLPVLNQGGLLKLKLSNGRDYTIKIMHDPNSGGSDNINRQGGLKTQFLNEDDDLFLDKDVHADLYIAGHQHHRSVVSKEVYYDRMTGKEKSVAFVQIGTSKGIDKDNQDPFLVAQGKGPTIGPGPDIIVHQIKGNSNGASEVTKEWVNYGYENAGDIYDVAKSLHRIEDQLNGIERQKLTQELLGTIISRVEKPVTEFNFRGSSRSPKEKPGRAPLFEDLRWKINNLHDFPVLVYLLANARYGSSSHEGAFYKKTFADILDQSATNPFKFILAMRHFVDKGVSHRFDRREILNNMANDLGPTNDQKSLLGFMLSSTLLEDGWRKDVVEKTRYFDHDKGRWKSETDVDEGFLPGDELYYKSRIKGVPLYVNEAIMYLNLGKVDYSFFLLDRLGRSGSEFNLVQGLVQTRKKEHVTTDITTGGHMPLAGYSVYPPRPRVYLANGGFSNWDSGGKGNDKRVATGGQAVILFSDKKLIIPASNFPEAADIFNALMIDKGLTAEEKEKLDHKTK